jgi:hypothetical protein
MPFGIALYVNRVISVYLSATSGNRTSETVIKVKRKPAGGLKHIGRYSMRVTRMSQEGIRENLSKQTGAVFLWLVTVVSPASGIPIPFVIRLFLSSLCDIILIGFWKAFRFFV